MWISKQKEVVSKLAFLQKKKDYPEIQDYVADYQLLAYRTVLDILKFSLAARLRRQKQRKLNDHVY